GNNAGAAGRSSIMERVAMHSSKLLKINLSALFALGLGTATLAPVNAAATTSPEALVVSGVNDVTFGANNHNDHLGNGFVLEYQGRYFGVTAKHVLLMTKNTGAKGTEIPAQTQWVLRNKGSADLVQPFGKALNTSANEALDMKVLERDSLVFELGEVPAGFVALKLASKAVAIGDELTAVGCSYDAPADCRGERFSGKVVEFKAPNVLVDLGKTDLRKLFGLSGAPVLNASGELAGIVSQSLPDKSGVERIAYADLNYLRQVLQQVVTEKQS
ncbi:MAG: serine protease, partial [Gammaproteobacteria bacterium]|nr:serine protease [Gammaproteobacteria bacterium]